MESCTVTKNVSVGRLVAWLSGSVLTPLLFAISLMLAAPLGVAALTFNVNNTADVVDNDPGDRDCFTGRLISVNGQEVKECTLRAAIMEANSVEGTDTINVPAGLYRLRIATGTSTDSIGRHGDLKIPQSLIIQGAGAGQTIIDGAIAQTRIFRIVRPGRAATTVTIAGVTLQNGTGRGAGHNDGHGGAILVGSRAQLILRDSVLIDNKTAFGGQGGGLLAEGPVFISGSSILDNRAGQGGGGIANYNQMTIETSSILDNMNEISGGGGILNSSGRLIITGSTIARNGSGGGTLGTKTGGGIFNQGEQSFLDITNSTISSNKALFGNGHGGGINNNGTVFLTNVTITDNETQTTGGGVSNSQGLNVFLANTIIANNWEGDKSGEVHDDCDGVLTSEGFNLVGRGCTGFRMGEQDQVGGRGGIDPLLQRLGSFGGPTLTHAPANESPAINAGNPAPVGGPNFACPLRDQRGFFRRDRRCDIGAVER
jgi:CSLREA domain-containing protein